MTSHKMTAHQIKIHEAMGKVYADLIAFKKKMNSELVIMKYGKIVRIKPLGKGNSMQFSP